jgi:hypothetical protein
MESRANESLMQKHASCPLAHDVIDGANGDTLAIPVRRGAACALCRRALGLHPGYVAEPLTWRGRTALWRFFNAASG